jgi:hypothetical protein
MKLLFFAVATLTDQSPVRGQICVTLKTPIERGHTMRCGAGAVPQRHSPYKWLYHVTRCVEPPCGDVAPYLSTARRGGEGWCVAVSVRHRIHGLTSYNEFRPYCLVVDDIIFPRASLSHAPFLVLTSFDAAASQRGKQFIMNWKGITQMLTYSTRVSFR